MSDGFDPYRQWLNLDLGHPPRNHHELLGLTAHDADANAIVSGRDRMLGKLRNVQPAERGNEWEQLVRQVQEAGRYLLASEVLADEKQQPRSVPQAASPATMATQDSNQAVPLARLVSATSPAEPPVETSPAVAVGETESPLPVVVRRASRYRRRRHWPLWILPLILVVVLGIASYSLWNVLRSELGTGLPVVSQADVLPANPRTNSPQSGRDQRTAGRPIRQPISSEDQPVATGARQGTTSDQNRQRGSGPGRGLARVKQPLNETLDLSGEEQQVVRKILVALAGQEFGRATDLIETLTATNQQMGNSLKTLKIYVGFYWEGIEEAWQDLQAGQELDYRGQKVIVVERHERELVVRAGGRNETIDGKPIEPWLEKQLAVRWFDQADSANWMTLGAREFVRPGSDLQQVRRYWKRAARAGEPAERLLGLLEWSQLRPRPEAGSE